MPFVVSKAMAIMSLGYLRWDSYVVHEATWLIISIEEIHRTQFLQIHTGADRTSEYAVPYKLHVSCIFPGNNKKCPNHLYKDLLFITSAVPLKAQCTCICTVLKVLKCLQLSVGVAMSKCAHLLQGCKCMQLRTSISKCPPPPHRLA